MPKIYRVMRDDAGQPMLGESATTLGVRIQTDIHPDAAGRVHPGDGGLSVSPTLKGLPARLVPRRLQPLVPRAAGNDNHFVWSMGEGPFLAAPVAPGLQLRPDPANERHGFVEPDTIMDLADYCDAIRETRDQWAIDEK